MAISLFVDRISGKTAILLYNEGEYVSELPLGVLPPGTAEGDWLSVSFERDTEKTGRMKSDIDSLMDELEK